MECVVVGDATVETARTLPPGDACSALEQRVDAERRGKEAGETR
jgi:hypothetical protein